ncbi:hypothetical protein K440DRAFT_621773 [Wilcoxina mikolae CBS 423.85]|nr:hypothetical protein K440DRAFT_621773 [Wilcoxina mikolae CBS 423.85]
MWFGIKPGQGNQADGSLAQHSLSIAGRAIDPNVARLWLLEYTGLGGASGFLCTDLNYCVYGPIGCAHNLPTFNCFNYKAV